MLQISLKCVCLIFTGADFKGKKSHRDILFNRMVNIPSFFQVHCLASSFSFIKVCRLGSFGLEFFMDHSLKWNDFPADVCSKCPLSKFKCYKWTFFAFAVVYRHVVSASPCI